MQRRVLSSKLTFVYKIVFPILFVVSIVWGSGIWLSIRKVPGLGFMTLILIVMAINLVWAGWLALRSCRVETDGENFYVSNFGTEAVIPRADLYEATEMRWLKPYWITLRLRRPSVFGDKIVFIPPWRIGGFWTANPLVEELNAARTRW
ncbi:MAG TPA: hypothetical protein PLK77_05570 [Pyrinomonadaceae bacterium]|nr:hypothetical protein [Pyrinomonadaceae bacterium]